MVDDPRVGARYMIERTRAARDAGLDSLFVGDHHVTSFPYYQNNAILGRMLAEWGDKPYGALYLLPLWHPVLLAEQIGTLASLAQGPFIMQCGLGDAHQCHALGVAMSDRVGMFNTSIKTMRALWRGETVDESRYWHIHQANISPRPAENVDIWVGAVVDAAILRTARIADGWLASPSLTPDEAAVAIDKYKAACAEHHRKPGTTAIRREIFIGATREDAIKSMAPYLAKGHRGMNEAALMTGSVNDVAEQISALESKGFSDIIVRNISRDQHECLATIERLAEVKSILDR